MACNRLAVLSCMFDNVAKLKVLLRGCCATQARFLDKKKSHPVKHRVHIISFFYFLALRVFF